MGAIVANATEESRTLIYAFGRNLGIAFQLQDDYLDAFGNPETFGKQVGGDIIENKKTFLYLKALALDSENDQKELIALFSEPQANADEKVTRVKALFQKAGSDDAIKMEIEKYTQLAFASLEKIDAPEAGKRLLKELGVGLMQRAN